MDKKTFTDENKTGCCPVFDPKPWDESEVIWQDKKFIRDTNINVYHIPVNMKQVITRMFTKIKAADAEVPTNEFVWLSTDITPWKGEQLMSVSKEVPGAENVTLSGTFLTKVFDGPYQAAGKWYKELLAYAKSKGKEVKKAYFFYTCCPKCSKAYGHNYAVGFVQV